ncbi:hypothetical protein AVEN_158897-1 [Araneus ventricosus]|uniref:Uncharacterized protein n=1 Tax=Araneus ventricosus TaxID=182803 RepID=A0A4Y2B9N5_ARAVE|nr:hypothetical protein AVEN_158897-1 [Araneus ventricosus]
MKKTQETATTNTRRATLRGVKLDIHDQTSRLKWRDSTPHHSNFQPIHLGGSFTQAPCKSHYLSLRSPRGTAPTPPLAFKREPPPCFPEKASLSLPHGSIFGGSHFFESFAHPPPWSHFRFYGPTLQMDNERR